GLQKDFSAYVLSKNSETSITVQAASLPAGKIEFMFSAYAAAENAPVTDMRFGTSFRTLPAGGSDQKFEIIAEVNYKNKPAQTFVASFDYKNKGKQFCALPVTLDKSLLADLQNIVLKHVYTGSGAAAFTDFRLAPCEWEYKTFDQFKNISFSETGTVLLNKGISSNAYEKSVVNYKYDDEHRLITKRLTRTTNGISNNINIIGTNKNDTVNHAVSKYYYNDYGSIVRTEKYIEGEEGSKGILAEETVHDEKGNVIKSVIYNTLDSTAKSYSENEYSENGRLKAKIDETGENRTVIEYAPDTDDVQTVINPDGGKLSYGRDYITGAVTGITQSTEAGESNSIETKYTYGVITGLKSGLNTVNYEYDAKRRKTRVLLNDKERVKYEYTENAQSYGITVNDIDFDSITSDKITATLKGDARPVILTPPILPGTPPYIPPPYNGDNLPDIKTETITDKRGNLIRVSVDDSVQFANSYNNYNALVKSADNITGSMLTTTYDDANKRATKSGRTAGTKPGYKYLAAVSESYGYNDRGELSERTVSINETAVQTYVYAYKNNAARNLDSINLPNDLLYKPQTDAMGRNAGRLLTDLSGNNKFGEYINYRKVGDRTTDMVSSIRYGEVKDGQYVIGNGLDYKYDGRGNITEIWESGELTVTYTYDKLQRLVREDNMSKGKSWFYSYDNNGNILSKKEADYTRKPADEITEYNYKKLYSYDGDKLTGCGGESFDYDVFGNPKKYRDKTLKWQECKLVDFNGITFAYDGYGKRVKKGDVIYTYDIGGKLLRQSDGTDTLEFIYDESGLSGVKYGDMQYVYRKNIQGDITHIFDINGELAASYNYDAWGNHTVSDSEGNPITGASHIGNLNPFRYRGYLYDIETKLYYLQTRYYDPEIGRFISQDEISYLDPSTINGLNLYAYCGNNPVMRIDETGYSWKSFWKAFGRFAIGLIIMVVAVVTVVSLLITMPILFALPVVGGFLTQTFISAIMYGGFVLASSWDKQIRADMNAIGWNPFNTNEDAVLESGKVSFYKGMPVVRTNLKRSGSFGAILLRRRDSDGNKIEVNELRHEWGHGAQHLIMGSILYGVSIAIPSALSDAENPNYYDSPWEVTADMLGGVSRHHGDGAERAGKDYFIFSMLCYLGLFI
ncbi:MAG: RHS repeat-associated core domain-containing protein, partial [Endomicrobia bacterium]|nr:RHS repeat-associated core domain-containing protein [Endomicrobiia bacterium]